MDPLHSHYERDLPHRLPPGSTVFITYRLAGTIPREVREQWEAERLMGQTDPETERRRKRTFARYDAWLDADEASLPPWLTQAAVSAFVRESLHHFDKQEYDLHAYTIMPNHVHLLLTIADSLSRPFFRVLQSQKRYSSHRANALLGRTGAFWQPESYDHVVRDGAEFERIRAYILNNPVKAGLVSDWEQWPHSYCQRP